jgi:endonuclease-3
MMFSFGMKVFPVDTHIHRIAMRLGLVDPKSTAEETCEQLTPVIAPEDRYEMHVLLIEHGRKTCRARNPQCERCVLLQLCPFGERRVTPT